MNRTIHVKSVGTLLSRRPCIELSPDEIISRTFFMRPELHVEAACIVENGALIGIFTEHDFIKRILVEGRDIRMTRVRDVMTPDPVTVFVTASLEEAAETASRHRCSYLPVTDENGLAGMIYVCDLFDELRVLQNRMQETQRAVFSSMVKTPYSNYISHKFFGSQASGR